MFLEHSASAFEGEKKTPSASKMLEAEQEATLRKIGSLAMDNDWLLVIIDSDASRRLVCLRSVFGILGGACGQTEGN